MRAQMMLRAKSGRLSQSRADTFTRPDDSVHSCNTAPTVRSVAPLRRATGVA